MKTKNFFVSILSLLTACLITTPVVCLNEKAIDKTFNKFSSYADNNNYVINGNNLLTGYFAVNGSSRFTLQTKDGATINEGVTWSLENNTQGNNVRIEKLMSNKAYAVFVWNDNLPAGTYNFTIKAVYKYETTTKEITLKINKVPITEIDVNDELIGAVGFSDNKTAYARIESGKIMNCIWSISGNTQNGKINIQSDGDALIKWTDDLQAGTYDFTIKATCFNDESIFLTKNVTLNIKPVPENIYIELKKDIAIGYIKESGQESDLCYIKSTYPRDANDTVIWSLEENSNSEKISIDPSNGTLKWIADNNIDGAWYPLKIKATSKYNPNVVDYKNIALLIKHREADSVLINGKTRITADAGIGGNSQYTANVIPENAKQDVTWSLENNQQDDLLISENGLLEWNEDLQPGTYNLTIKATCVHSLIHVSKTKDITLILNQPTATKIQVSGDSIIYAERSGSSAYSATLYPKYSEPNFRWYLQNVPLGYDSAIKIDENGVLTWSNLPYKTFNFRVCAQSNQITNVNDSMGVTLIVDNPPTEILIEGPDVVSIEVRTNRYSGYTINLNPSDASRENLDLSLENVNEDGSRDDYSKFIEWDNVFKRECRLCARTKDSTDFLLPGTYHLILKVTNSLDPNIFATKNITLNVTYKNPRLGNIDFSWIDENNNIVTPVNDTINIPYGKSTTVNSSIFIFDEEFIDPNLKKKWLSENLPYQGITINSDTGEIYFSDKTPIIKNYQITVSCKLGNETARRDVYINVDYANPILGDITLTKVSGDATLTGNTIDQVYGSTSTFNASCNITNIDSIDPSLTKSWSLENAPNGVSINPNTGLVTIDQNIPRMNNSSFSITYTVGTFTKTQNYILNVDYAVPMFGDITLSGNGVIDNNNINLPLNQAATIITNCQISNMDKTDPNATKIWSLKNAPSGVIINSSNGQIYIPDNLAINDYSFIVICRYGVYTKESTVDLAIGYETPMLDVMTLTDPNNITLEDNNITINYHQSGSFQASCSIKNQDKINPILNKHYSLDNAPNGISIDSNTGLVSITDNVVISNQQKMLINYQVGNVLKSLTVNLSINYQTPDLGDINFIYNGVYDNQFEFEWQSSVQKIHSQCNINNDHYIDPNLQTYWEIKNNPNQSAFNINANGELWIDPKLATPNVYNLEVVFNANNISKSQILIIKITYASTQGITISGSSRLEAIENKSGEAYYNALVNPFNANPNDVAWSLINNDEHIWIDRDTGILHWDNTLKVGETYRLKIVANSRTNNQLTSNILEVTIIVKNNPSNFPIWSYPTIIGSIMLMTLIIILVVKYFKSYFKK